jgi:hypothetical protein
VAVVLIDGLAAISVNLFLRERAGLEIDSQAKHFIIVLTSRGAQV